MSIDRAAYSDPAVFDDELEAIFTKRVFVGTDADFAQVDDYRSLQLGRRAITVRRTPDGVRAFNNVCLHRNNLIDPLGRGNHPFRCGYHGWSYGNDGVLKFAPLADENAIRNHRLTIYPVSKSSGLYFLGQDCQPDVSDVPLAIGETQSVLAPSFCEGILDHACNWKLLVENVLEIYHLSYVHRSTFVPSGFTSTADYRYGMKGGVSWGAMTPKHGDNNDKSERYKHISSLAGHYYKHAFVFPNLFVANSNGFIGFQGGLYPIDAAHTRLEWSLFELPALSGLAAPIREHFRNDAIDFAKATLLEDKALVESCQIGLSSIGTASQFQPNEGRITHFHSMYLERMRMASER